MTAPMPADHGVDLLTDLALILCVAAVTTTVFQRLRQPVVLGYLLAGVVVGPHLPVPLFADEALTHTLSELGVILLMFSLGLEFSLRKLVKVAPTAGVIAVIQCSLMIWLGYLVARAVRLDGLRGAVRRRGARRSPAPPSSSRRSTSRRSRGAWPRSCSAS